MSASRTHQLSTETDHSPTRLTVLYDERCGFCLRCRDWLLTQPCRVEVELLPAGSELVRDRYGTLPWLGHELVVVDDRGHAWIGPAAFITCLWATARYRKWAYLLSRPRMAPFADRFFLFVSKRRGTFSGWFSRQDPDCSWCDQLRLQGKVPD
jgi:predicted DCC family thiol-disulfide oxidoreductase YuxK